MSYWRQFDKEELDQMHGKDNDLHEDDLDDCDCKIEEREEEEPYCRHCGGGGCNDCLMLEW